MRFNPNWAAVLMACWAPAWAEPPPRSLDQALAATLALGVAAGCGPAFGVPDFSGALDPDAELDAYLTRERAERRLGNELTAICGRSAVASAASLGGSLGSLQTTKTVSQFRMARSRADSRLDARGKRADLQPPILLAQLGVQASPITASSVADAGLAVFMQLENERRDRTNSALEAGYAATVSEGLVGVDYAGRDPWVAGAWIGYRSAEADYRRTSPLIAVGNLDIGRQAELCKVEAGGGFDDKGARMGVYVARRFDAAFVDLGLQHSRRSYDYRRNVCAIEAGGTDITPDPASPSGFISGNFPLDDVYAGTIAGSARLTEWGASARGGFDFGGDRFQWGPRLSLTYLRTTLGAFTETGRTSVTHQVTSAGGALVTDRNPGDPIGLELAYDAQRRTSLQSEAQLVAAYRHEAGFGTLVPRIAVSWLHEFKGGRELVNVRMAQDRRASPTRFSFTTDGVDKNKGSVALGLSLTAGPQFAADVEVSRLLADDRFDSTRTSLQAFWRF